VLDVHPSPGGEVVDDDNVVVLCQGIYKVRADEAGPAGDDVAHEESMVGGGLGFSKLPLTDDVGPLPEGCCCLNDLGRTCLV
jgi:hypothetical protein